MLCTGKSHDLAHEIEKLTTFLAYGKQQNTTEMCFFFSSINNDLKSVFPSFYFNIRYHCYYFDFLFIIIIKIIFMKL